MSLEGLTMVEFMKKSCDVMRQQQSALAKPFKVFGNLKDLVPYTEDVYISTENSYHARYKRGYKIAELKKGACVVHIIPHEEISIEYYKQRSSYKFDWTRRQAEQWVRSGLPSSTTSKLISNAMVGLWDFKVRLTGRKDRIANLFCEISETSLGKMNEIVGTVCMWKSDTFDRLVFLGHPHALALNSTTKMDDGTTNQQTAWSVNIKEAYNSAVFQVPKEMLNMPFYADEPNYTEPEKEDANLDCKAENGRTGINLCAGPVELAKWCKSELDKTGEDRRNNDDMDDDSE